MKKAWDIILDFLKGRAVKLALKKLLGSPYAVGFQAWLITFLIEELFEEVVEPLAKAALVEVGYLKDKVDGKLTADKIKKARKDGELEDYNSAVDSVFH